MLVCGSGRLVGESRALEGASCDFGGVLLALSGQRGVNACWLPGSAGLPPLRMWQGEARQRTAWAQFVPGSRDPQASVQQKTLTNQTSGKLGAAWSPAPAPPVSVLVSAHLEGLSVPIRIRTERIFNSTFSYKHWLKGVSSPFLLPSTPLIQRISLNPEASRAASVPRRVCVCVRA